MTPADRAVLIATAKRLAIPVASCVAASIRPDHLLSARSRDELMALVIVLAEAAHPVRLREVVQAGDDGLDAQGIAPGGYLAGHRNAGQVAEYAVLRGNGMDAGPAAERLGIAERTAGRYEAALIAAGKATWRKAAEGNGQRREEAADAA